MYAHLKTTLRKYKPRIGENISNICIYETKNSF